MQNRQGLALQELLYIAVMAALIAVLSQISVPMPGSVPITLSTLGVFLAGVILGGKKGMCACLVYLLLGAIGLPVFTQFHGGLSRLVGPTGGFLVAFPLMAWMAGVFAEGGQKKKTAAGLVIGNLICYLLGTVWFVILTHNSVGMALTACVIPFIPGDILKSVLAAWLGTVIRTALHKAGLLAPT